MRRVFLLLLCCVMLTTAVSAAGTVSSLQSNTTVHSNGTCEVTMNVQLTLSEVPRDILFPLPAEAKNISLNGGLARTSVSGDVRNVDLGGIIRAAGTHSFVIRYDLPDAITNDAKLGLRLTIRLLAGFAYPVENMSFSVTLPGAPQRRPEFSSTYYQEAVDTLMDITTEGNTIHCSFLQGLKDHESLSMTLPVTEEMFPQPLMKRWSLSADDVLMYICAAVALIYWLICLRALPPKRLRRTREPVGLTAGEMGCCLTGQGTDFAMMVLSWAQMGYLLIQLDDNGRVLLHKRMEMGNERKDFEARYFHALFGRRKTVDGTGHHFARLSAKAARVIPNVRDYYLPGSGNPMIFRALLVGIGICGGVSLARSMVSDTAWQVILGLFFSALGALLSWQIHNAAASAHLRKKLPHLITLATSALWLLIGALCGEFGVAVFVIGTQWLGGLAVAYGGRRSEMGRQAMADILGLRRYFRSVPKEELQYILQANPDYYYHLAPYASAMGMDRAFARQMGNVKLSECNYLTTGMDGHLTAREWNRLLREVVQLLDDRKDKMALQKLLGK